MNLKLHPLLTIIAIALSAFSAMAEQEFYTPEQDREGLRKNTAIQERLPNILIIGDSISIGYTMPVAEYEKNLEAMVLQLKETGATLIWANTTRVPENEPGRIVGDALIYNAAAGEIMQRHGIAIDDLYTLTLGFDSSLAAAESDVHYTKQGYAKLAKQVAKSISEGLKKGSARPNLLDVQPPAGRK